MAPLTARDLSIDLCDGSVKLGERGDRGGYYTVVQVSIYLSLTPPD